MEQPRTSVFETDGLIEINDEFQQPKLELAQRMAARGFWVPETFPTLRSAVQSGEPFTVRSEHPEDIDGISGLGSSMVVMDAFCPGIDGELEDGQEELEAYLREQDWSKICTYAQLRGIAPERYADEMSYTYWKFIQGQGHTIIGDSAVPGRYHIFTRPAGEAWNGSFIVVEDSKPIISESKRADLGAVDYIALIEWYEAAASQFNGVSRPILEAVTSQENGRIYFLQYHAAAPYAPTTHEFDGRQHLSLEQEGMRAAFVRGATLPQWTDLILNIHHKPGGRLEPESAGLDLLPNELWSTAMANQRDVGIVYRTDLQRLVAGDHASRSHTDISEIYMPRGMTIVLNFQQVRALLAGAPDFASSIPISVISDGRTAYVRPAPMSRTA